MLLLETSSCQGYRCMSADGMYRIPGLSHEYSGAG